MNTSNQASSVLPDFPYFQLDYMGYNYKEEKTFIIDRPNGTDNYLFLHFLTEVILTIHGTTYVTKPGALVIFEPGCPQNYHHPENGFTNDWMHMIDGDATFKHLKRFFADLQLPLNRPFYLSPEHFSDSASSSSLRLRARIQEIEQEAMMRGLAYQEHLHALITSFFIRLARVYRQGALSVSEANSGVGMHRLHPYEASFRQLRANVLTHYDAPWTLEAMAAEVGLSRSRFCTLYKEFFHMSPKEDLMHERFIMAKHLLVSTQLPIAQVASRVGYDNLYHFSKQFKLMMGRSPGRFRV